jgi:hypothetical protein
VMHPSKQKYITWRQDDVIALFLDRDEIRWRTRHWLIRSVAQAAAWRNHQWLTSQVHVVWRICYIIVLIFLHWCNKNR